MILTGPQQMACIMNYTNNVGTVDSDNSSVLGILKNMLDWNGPLTPYDGGAAQHWSIAFLWV